MGDTNPNDVERALAAFGATPIKYRSFGKHHLRPAAAHTPAAAVLDDTVYDPFAPRAPAPAAIPEPAEDLRPSVLLPANVSAPVEPEPPPAATAPPVPFEPVPFQPVPFEPAPFQSAPFQPAPVEAFRAEPVHAPAPDPVPYVPPTRSAPVNSDVSSVSRHVHVDVSTGSLAFPIAGAREPVAAEPPPAPPPLESPVQEVAAQTNQGDRPDFVLPAAMRTGAALAPSHVEPVAAGAATPADAPPPRRLPTLGSRLTAIEQAPSPAQTMPVVEHRSIAEMFRILNGKSGPIRRPAGAPATSGEVGLFRRL